MIQNIPVILKIALRYIVRILLVILIPIILYGIAGTVLSFISTNPKAIDCTSRNQIYITSNGIHVDFIIPVEHLPPDLSESLRLPLNVKYVAFGWGDREFYLETPTWQQLKFGVTLRAVFLKTASAIHVTNYYGKSNSWESMAMCTEQYDRLMSYISNSFKTGSRGEIVHIPGAGYTENDSFYEATGKFSFMKTCNNWVNIGLKTAGIKTSLWSPFDFGVLYHVRKATSAG